MQPDVLQAGCSDEVSGQASSCSGHSTDYHGFAKPSKPYHHGGFLNRYGEKARILNRHAGTICAVSGVFLLSGLMKTAYRLAIIFGIMFSLCVVIEQVRPLLSCLFGLAACLLGLGSLALAALIKGFIQWRKTSRRWIGPFVVCVAFILAFPIDQAIGAMIADMEFKSHLQEYDRFVEDVRNGTIPCEAKSCMIQPKIMPSNVKAIFGARYPDGSVFVQFLVGEGFMYHTGYIFDGSGTNKDCIAAYKDRADRVGLRPLVGNWYYFAG
jgi:hypothetical protein